MAVQMRLQVPESLELHAIHLKAVCAWQTAHPAQRTNWYVKINLKNKSHCREKNFSFPKPRVPNLWNLGFSSLRSQMSHMRPHTQNMAERTTGEFHWTLLFLCFKETSFVTVELHICFLKLLNAGSSWTVKRSSHKVYTFWVCTAACSC